MKNYATAKMFTAASDADRKNMTVLVSGSIEKLASAKTPIDVEARKATFRFSDASIDSMGDIIQPLGWKLDRFKANPIALFGHDHNKPIGRAENLKKNSEALWGTIAFMPGDVSELAETVWKMVAGGWLKAVSVGFMPIKWEVRRDEVGNFCGYEFKEQDLSEISCVACPANPSALLEAKSAGVNLRPLREDYEKNLDAWERSTMGLLIPRDKVEQAWKNAGEPLVRSVSVETDSDENSSTANSDERGGRGEVEKDGQSRAKADVGHDGDDHSGIDLSGDESRGDGDQSKSAETRDHDVDADDHTANRGGSNGSAGRDIAPADNQAKADVDGRKAEGKGSAEQISKAITRESGGTTHVYNSKTGAYLGYMKGGALVVDRNTQNKLAAQNLDAIMEARAMRKPSYGQPVLNSRKRAMIALARVNF